MGYGPCTSEVIQPSTAVVISSSLEIRAIRLPIPLLPLTIRIQTLHMPQNTSPDSIRSFHSPFLYHKHSLTGGYAEAEADALPVNMLNSTCYRRPLPFPIGVGVFALA